MQTKLKPQERGKSLPSVERRKAPRKAFNHLNRIDGLTSRDPNESDRPLTQPRRREDLLERELSNGRISHAAFQEGRRIQDHAERSARSRSPSAWNPISHVDNWRQHGRVEDRVVAQASCSNKFEQEIQRIAGAAGVRLVLGVLVHGKTFDEMSEQGSRATHSKKFLLKQFRSILEQLATARMPGCVYRKLDSAIMMVKPAKDRL